MCMILKKTVGWLYSSVIAYAQNRSNFHPSLGALHCKMQWYRDAIFLSAAGTRGASLGRLMYPVVVTPVRLTAEQWLNPQQCICITKQQV